MRITRKSKPALLRPDLTAMVDVVFSLISFFLVFASLAIIQGVPVDLPASETTEHHAVQPVVITVTQAGQLFFNDDSVTLSGLKQRIQQAVQSNPNTVAAIHADQSVEFTYVMAVIDALRISGVSKFDMGATPVKGDSR